MSFSLEAVSHDLNAMIQSMTANAFFVLSIIGVALLIYLINNSTGKHLNRLGIRPRRLPGLTGLVCAPWLHGSLSHWFMNAFFFFILSVMTLSIHGRQYFVELCLFIAIGSGFLVWLFGRRAVHIGASGVVMGLWGYLLINAIRNPTIISIAVAAMVLYFFGGMIVNIVPQNKETSWEAHLFGAIIGVSAAFIPWFTVSP